MNILTLVVYILLILKCNKLEKRVKGLENYCLEHLIDTDIDEDFWGEENETEKV